MESLFVGLPIQFDGTISDIDVDGVYDVNTTTMWSGTTGTWDSAWDITNYGDGAASVVYALVWIPENPPYIIQGTLISAVPIPGAIWLFSSGLIGMVGLARRKKG